MKKSEVLFTALCLVLLLCLFLPASATGAPAVWIQGHNLMVTDHVEMIYYVGEESLPDGAAVGVAIYRSTKDSYTKETADALLETAGGSEKGFSKYYYNGIAENERADVIFARGEHTGR